MSTVYILCHGCQLASGTSRSGFRVWGFFWVFGFGFPLGVWVSGFFLWGVCSLIRVSFDLFRVSSGCLGLGFPLGVWQCLGFRKV